MEKNYINGSWTKGEGIKLKSFSPNDGRLINHYNCASSQQVKEAIDAAHNAFLQWKNLDLNKRIDFIQNVKDLLITAYGEEGEATFLKTLINKEVGKRLNEADIEVIESSDMIDFFSKTAIDLFSDKQIELNKDLWPNKKSEIFFEPYGVVGVIKAWNYPLEIPIWSIIPALLAGNTIVLKPSEHSTAVGIEIAKMFDQINLPKGVFNLVIGGREIGKEVVDNRNVNMISFTGSVKAGKEISLACAKQMKHCSLELSGNDAAIVDNDVDVELAANGLVWGSFCNTGQVCVGIKRAFIHKNVYEKIKTAVISKTKDLRNGIDFGPLISQKQLDQVQSFVDDAVKNQGNIIAGGNRINKDGGFYFSPTVIEGLNNKMKLYNEECFGPLLPITKVDSIDEAIRLANDSKYGLGASVWSKNQEKAKKIAKSLDTGMVWINDVNVAFAEAPWPARKISGNGIDLSTYGMMEYVRVKHYNYEFSDSSRREWWYPY